MARTKVKRKRIPKQQSQKGSANLRKAEGSPDGDADKHLHKRSRGEEKFSDNEYDQAAHVAVEVANSVTPIRTRKNRAPITPLSPPKPLQFDTPIDCSDTITCLGLEAQIKEHNEDSPIPCPTPEESNVSPAVQKLQNPINAPISISSKAFETIMTPQTSKTLEDLRLWDDPQKIQQFKETLLEVAEVIAEDKNDKKAVQERMKDVAFEEAVSDYDHLKNRFEGPEVIGTIHISQLQEFLQRTPCTQTKLLTKEIRLNSTIAKHNKTMLAKFETRPNPRLLGCNFYHAPSNFHGVIVQELFKECGHPNCIKSRNQNLPKEERCTFSIKWQLLTSNATDHVQVIVQGWHCKQFVPVDKFFPQPADVKKQMKGQFNTNSKPITIAAALAKQQLKNSSIQLLSMKQISNQKYYHKKQDREADDEFESALIKINKFCKSGHFKLLTPKEELDSQTKDNFHWVIISPTLFKESVQYAKDIVGLDGVFKVTHIKLPIYALTVTTKDHYTIPLALCITKSQNHTAITRFLQAVEQEVSSTLGTLWKPTVMIDDGAPERLAVSTMQWIYILCKFHFKVAINKRLVQYVSEEKIRIALDKLVSCMFNALTEQEYTNYYNAFKKTCLNAGADQFLNYFNKEWHVQHKHWTCEFRYSLYGLWATNNFTERFIQFLEQCAGGKSVLKRIDELIDAVYCCFTIKNFEQHKKKSKNTYVKELQKRMAEGFKGYLLDPNFVEAGSNEFSFSVGKYDVNVMKCSCTCPDFEHHAWHCKHLFAAFLYYAKEHKITSALVNDITALNFLGLITAAIHNQEYQFDSGFIGRTGVQVHVDRFKRLRKKKQQNNDNEEEEEENAAEIQTLDQEPIDELEVVVIKVLGVYYKGKKKMMTALFTDDEQESDVPLDPACQAVLTFKAEVMNRIAKFPSALTTPQEQRKVIGIYFYSEKGQVIVQFENEEKVLAATNAALCSFFFTKLGLH